MSKDEKISELTQRVSQLKFENEQLKRLIFGSKKERFVPSQIADNQASLFAQSLEEASTKKEEVPTEKISYERKKAKKKHAGRNKIPPHLPIREVIIEPDEDTTGMKKIGEEITETLEYTPASLVKVITRRIKYVDNQNTKILIGTLPSRPIEKGIAEASLLSHIFISKFIDHLPFYRQRQIFKRNYDWDLPSSTLNDWFISCCTLLKPLYDLSVKKMLESHYLQADESPISVLESEKPRASHKGYMWVYRNPINKMVVFQYRKGRGANGPKQMLINHHGYLQTDGYKVYDKIEKLGNFKLIACWAHARRKFFEALHFDKDPSSFALSIIKKIYFHEDQCENFTPNNRKTYRLENTKALMDQLLSWAQKEEYKLLPKSPIAKAIGYLLKQWKKLYRVLDDGQFELDNNRIENKIRPLALGRKNYLFAGNHSAAQNIAMMYSFFATCKEYNINPYLWLKHVLQKLPDTNIKDIELLLPNFSKEYV